MFRITVVICPVGSGALSIRSQPSSFYELLDVHCKTRLLFLGWAAGACFFLAGQQAFSGLEAILIQFSTNLLNSEVLLRVTVGGPNTVALVSRGQKTVAGLMASQQFQPKLVRYLDNA